jgi:hypothetical protein
LTRNYGNLPKKKLQTAKFLSQIIKSGKDFKMNFPANFKTKFFRTCFIKIGKYNLFEKHFFKWAKNS